MVLALTPGVHSGGAHESHSTVQGVEKQADVFDHKGPPVAGRWGRLPGSEKLLDQCLCLGYCQSALQNSLGGPCLQSGVLQREQGPGVALRGPTVT